jgi:hypothetical protein
MNPMIMRRDWRRTAMRGLVDAPPEEVLGTFTDLASPLMRMPISLMWPIHFDGQRQFFKRMCSLSPVPVIAGAAEVMSQRVRHYLAGGAATEPLPRPELTKATQAAPGDARVYEGYGRDGAQ